VVIDELARNGVRLIVLSPGSRSGALAIAAAAHPGIEAIVVIDERSAAFHALGRSKATGAPAAVVSTSGTAPANWFPAVVEADMSCSPLVLLSANRPEELRGIGANQTIDQTRMFGDKVRAFTEIAAPGDEDLDAGWRAGVSRAVGAALGNGDRPGPVHIDIAFREPTVPVSDDGRTRADPYPYPTEGRPGGAPWEHAPSAARGEVPRLGYRPRGLVIAGDGAYDRPGLMSAASELGWPVLGTALSELRGTPVIDSYHHLLAAPVPDRLRPQTVVAVGRIGPSERLEALFGMGEERVRIDAWGRHIDPGRNATSTHAADPVAALRHVEVGDRDETWAQEWATAASRVRRALRDDLAATTAASGAGVATALDVVDWGCLVAASSLPIREIDAHITRSGPVVANRGASGIDGLVSTALGVASALPRTVAMVGDLSLIHDGNGLLHDGRRDLVLVVVDNNGGGLFDSLPQATHAPGYERLFVTPHGRDLADLARFHRVGHARVEAMEGLVGAVEDALARGGTTLVVVPVDRAHDLATRRRLDAAAVSAVGDA
jgi:2-succinyl-5-enolpyruvyl-6-hydroxy-3-cyclohexene-1-carboxylate synthase